MATPAWPGGVPQGALRGSFNEELEDSKARYEVEVGEPLERSRTSLSFEIVSFQTAMTFTQRETLKTFYRTDLKRGVLRFTRKHPTDLAGADRTFKFVSPPRFSELVRQSCIATLTLRYYP